MRIFADPTELGSNSTLPEDVAAMATPLPHLEEKTGADLLISVLTIPAGSDMLLEKHLQNGALVQLKRLNDLQSSITDQRLFHDILRMREKCALPWLVTTGILGEFEGNAVVGEVESQREMKEKMVAMNVVGRQGLSFQAVNAALMAWRYYGGYVEMLPSDDLLLPWIERQAKTIQDILDGKVTELSPRTPIRELKAPTRVAWLASLFDGIGLKTAEAVYERLDAINDGKPVSLFAGLQYVTTYVATEIPGITKERVDKWREHIGLERRGQAGNRPPVYAALDLAWRLEETGEVYWRGPENWRYHYRNDGPFQVERLWTPYHVRELLGDRYTVTYQVENGEATASGILQLVVMDDAFEWLVMNDNKRIRMDKIVDMKPDKTGDIDD